MRKKPRLPASCLAMLRRSLARLGLLLVSHWSIVLAPGRRSVEHRGVPLNPWEVAPPAFLSVSIVAFLASMAVRNGPCLEPCILLFAAENHAFPARESRVSNCPFTLVNFTCTNLPLSPTAVQFQRTAFPIDTPEVVQKHSSCDDNMPLDQKMSLWARTAS